MGLPNGLKALGTGLKNVVTNPKEALNYTRYLLLGGDRPFGPSDTDQTPEQRLIGQAKGAQTPQDARNVLDQLVGTETYDDKTFLNILAHRDSLTKVLGVPDTAAEQALMLEPFSTKANALIGVGGVDQMRGLDPYHIADTAISAAVGDDPRKQLLYLRDQDPLSVMPFIFNRDRQVQTGGGGSWWDTLIDWAGRPIGSVKDVALSLVTAPERYEEIMGWHAYNDVQNPYMRLQMARHLYEYRFNLWDWSGTKEIEARRHMQSLGSQDLTDMERSDQFASFMKNQRLGVSGMFANMFTQMALDPLWLVPMGKLFDVGKVGMKATTGVEDFGKFARVAGLVGPEGRAAAGQFGLMGMLRTNELAYQTAKWTSPSRGVMRILTEQDPARLGDEIVRVLARWTAGSTGRDIFTDITKTKALLEAIRIGKPSAYIAEKMPGFFDDPVVASVSARIKGLPESTLYKSLETGTASDFFQKAIERGAETEIEAVLSHAFTGTVRNAAVEAQTSLYRATAIGRLMSGPYARYLNMMKPWVSLVTISRPAFIGLNLVNNFFTFMWSAARHPVLGPETFARSMWLEAGSVRAGGGVYPDVWQRMLSNPLVDMRPIDVEVAATHNVGIHDLLAPRVAKAVDVGLGDVPAEALLRDLERQTAQPVKQIIHAEPRRFLGLNTDKLMWPVYMAGRIDVATRRATFMLSLQEQIALAQSPSWAAKTVIPEISKEFINAGIDPAMARELEGSIIDRVNRALIGADDFSGQSADNILNAIFNDTLTKIGRGDPTAMFSATNSAWDYLTTVRGLDNDAARFVMRDLNPAIERASQIIESDLPAVLSGEKKLSSMVRKLNAIADDYYNSHDIARQLSNIPGMMRSTNRYTQSLRLTDEAIRADMVDTSLYLERHLRTLYRGNFDRRIARDLNTRLSDATAGLANRLHLIREEYLKQAKAGVDRVEAIGDLQKMWADYFSARDTAWQNVYDYVRASTAKISDAHVKLVDEWYDSMKSTFATHSEILQKAAAEGTDEAWKSAGNAVKNLYEKMANKRPQIFNFPRNDMPSAADVMDASGPLASQVDEFVSHMTDRLKLKLPDLKAGTVSIGDDAVSAVRTKLQGQLARNWNEARQQVIGQAMAKTDFVMLNYNNQYGADRFLQGFVPFEFWPTRSALHWGIRAARAPGGAAALYTALMSPAEYSKAYGLPDRLKFQIPVPMPFLDEMMKDTPIVNSLLGDADFGPVFWVDPMKYVFPYSNFRQHFDDQQRKSTMFGRVLDWFENYTPLSLNPWAKVIGSESGLIDKDAWGNVMFSGGPFGVPVTPTGQAAARWFYNGDLDAIPQEEQYTYTEKGHFSVPFLGQVLGLEPQKFDTYRAERAAWALATTDKLLPGQSHEANVRAAFEAVENHKGVAWARAERAAASETFLKQFTGAIGFPLGTVTGVQQGEQMWFDLKQAFDEYAKQGRLDDFYEKYPEFQVRSAVVKGVSDPKEKAKAIDTELYYEDLKRLVDDPFQKQLDEINSQLANLRNLTQTETVRDGIKQLSAELASVKDQQQQIRETLAKVYPNRESELSFNRDPRLRSLAQVRSDWYDLQEQPGETEEAFQARQQQFLNQFPAKGDGTFSESDWQELFKDQLLVKIGSNQAISAAIENNDFDAVKKLQDDRDKKLRAVAVTASAGLSRLDVESYLASFNRHKTPEEIKFDQANALFDTWMTLVGSGSTFSSREKGAISEYFRSLPEIQTYFYTSAIDLRYLTGQQKLDLMRRREIWHNYYSFTDPSTQLDYMSQVGTELRAINTRLGLPTLNIVDYRRPPAELPLGDPLMARLQAAAAAAREQGLRQQVNADGTGPTPEQLVAFSADLAADPDDPSPMTLEDLSYYIDPWGTPDQAENP